MLERVILIVDDNRRTPVEYIPMYMETIKELKKENPRWEKYDFIINYCPTMKEAVDYLQSPKHCVDVLVVDYDFGGEETFSSGIDLVKHVRENINRYCQIVFYTMHALSSIENDELIDLINSDVYMFWDKSAKGTDLGNIIFRAATHKNQIVESLENFYVKYSSMLDSYDYKIAGKDTTFEQLINNIRMDDEIGREFISKMLQKALLLNVDIEA